MMFKRDYKNQTIRDYIEARLDNFVRPIRFWYQRRTRGFDDSELWSLDQTILKFILPRLKVFRNLPPLSYPTEIYTADQLRRVEKGEELTKEESDKAFNTWLEILDKMILAIELQLKDNMFLKKDENGNYIYEGNEENFLTKTTGQRGHLVEDKEAEQQFKEGWELFHRFFFALWD